MSMTSTFQPSISKRVAFDRDARQALEREPGGGVEFAARVSGRPSLSASSSIGTRPSTSQEPSARAHDVLRRRLVLLRQFAGDRREHVGEGDQAEEVAVLVDHEGDVQRHLAEHLQHAQHVHVLGHVDRLAQLALDLQPASGDQIVDQILLLHHAERVAEIAAARDHQARIRTIGDLARDLASASSSRSIQ